MMRSPQRLVIFRAMLADGGADRFTLMLLRHLDREKFTPTLVLMRAGGVSESQIPPDVPIIRLESRRLMFAWFRLAQVVRASKPEVLLTLSPGESMVAAVTRMLSRRRFRLVFSQRNTFSIARRRGLVDSVRFAILRYFYEQADAIVAISQGVASDLVRNLAVSPGRVKTIYNPAYDENTLQLASVPPAHPWFGGAVPIVLAVGRLVDHKDYPTLLKAIALVRATRRVRLMILGDGPLEWSLRKMAEDLNLSSDTYFAGYTPNPFSFMRHCTVFALSSRSEGLCTALVEAMACGAAVVSTDCHAGPSEMIRTGENGLLVHVGDEVALAGAIEAVTRDEGLQRQLGQAARDRVAPLHAKSVIDAYAEVLAGRTGVVANRRGVRISVVLLGCGHIAPQHVYGWRATKVADIVGVFDPNAAAARRFASRHRIARVFSSVEEAVRSADVVDDCSPPAAHFGNAVLTLQHSRHYLVEKPLVLRSSDLEQILALQRETGAKICVVHNLKYNAGVQTAMQWVARGAIGDLITLDRFFMTDPAADRMLSVPRHWSHDLPGGRWLETLPHELYLAHSFMGPLDVVDVIASHGAGVGGNTAKDLCVVLAGNNRTATFRYSARSHSNERSLILRGTAGTIRVDILAGSALLFPAWGGKWLRGVGTDTVMAAVAIFGMIPDRVRAIWSRLTGRTPHSVLIGDFAKSIADGAPLPISLDEIAFVVRSTEEITRRLGWNGAPAVSP